MLRINGYEFSTEHIKICNFFIPALSNSYKISLSIFINSMKISKFSDLLFENSKICNFKRAKFAICPQ